MESPASSKYLPARNRIASWGIVSLLAMVSLTMMPSIAAASGSDIHPAEAFTSHSGPGCIEGSEKTESQADPGTDTGQALFIPFDNCQVKYSVNMPCAFRITSIRGHTSGSHGTRTVDVDFDVSGSPAASFSFTEVGGPTPYMTHTASGTPWFPAGSHVIVLDYRVVAGAAYHNLHLDWWGYDWTCDPPFADFDWNPKPACVGIETVFHDLSFTTTPGATLTKSVWDFGDGTVETHDPWVSTVSHTYLSTGTYPVGLTVWDSTGMSDSVIKDVAVELLCCSPPIKPLQVKTCPEAAGPYWASYFSGSTGLLGSGMTIVEDVAVDPSGYLVVGGRTYSTDLPTTPGAYQTGWPGGGFSEFSGFVAKFDPAGSSLEFATYVGGSADDVVNSVKIDANGDILAAGTTTSVDLIASGGSIPPAGAQDGFVVRLDGSAGSFMGGSYWGGSGDDAVSDVAWDGSGDVALVGWTESFDMPFTSWAPQGGRDALVVRMDAGFNLLAATHVGGMLYDSGTSLDFDSAGNVVLTGETRSAGFPVHMAAIPTFQGATDAFVTSLSPMLGSVVYSTFLGGTGSDHGTDLVIDGLDRTVVVGYTESADFPTVAPLQPAIAGSFDAFVTRLTPSGAIVQSTFHGGSSLDRAYSVTVDAADQVVIGGVTLSTDLPLAPGAGYHQGTYATNGDGFVSLLDAAMGSLVRSTYVGGTAGHGEDGVHGVAVNPLGLYAGGYGHSNDFPTTAGAFQSVAADPQPGFAMWLNH